MNDFIFPQYDGNSLLNVPSTILAHFGAKPLKKTLPKSYLENLEESDKIILFLIDGLGHNLYQKEAIKFKFFENLIKRSFYKPITTIFPSTTAAALGTINSGLSSYEHGLPEWNIYFREIDCVVQSLPFQPVVEADLEKTLNPPKDILFNQKTVYQILEEGGIPSFIFTPKIYAKTIYNLSSAKGAQTFGYEDITDFMAGLRELITQVKGKAYFYIYWPSVDTSEHYHGPWTGQVREELSLLSKIVQEDFVNKLNKKIAEKVSIILTADHGQIEVHPEKTIYLDKVLGLKECFMVSPMGLIIPPSGNSRDIFLNVKAEKIDFVVSLLKERLEGLAEVIKTAEFIKKGIFGEGEMHSEFLSRVGNILLLPLKNNILWYHFTPQTIYDKKGMHGGLSEDEMLIPFACVKLSQLQI